MKSSLSKNWITEKHIDFEYKKYVLLAYLQSVSEEFDATRLFPALSELISHYRSLLAIREGKESLYSSFPEKMTGASLMQFKLIYEKIAADDSLMEEIMSIINFSIPQFENYLAEGKKIYDFIEEHLHIQPVGIVPLNTMEGYLFLRNGDSPETRVYEYQITLFQNPDEKYRGIHTSFLASYRTSIANTFESIKADILHYHKKLPNPAAYAIETDMKFPMEESFLPLAKRTFLKYVSTEKGIA
jgi:hypothetical protein